MTKEIVNYYYDTETHKYVLLAPIVYHSQRFRKTITVEAGFKSDGASGPAPDLSGIGWWVHDKLCTTFAWDDGTPCSVLDSSLVLHDILKEEGRPIRARTWFVATLIYGYLRAAFYAEARRKERGYG